MPSVLALDGFCLDPPHSGCDSSSPEVLPERGLEDLIKIGDQLMDPDTREPFPGG